MSNSLRDQLLGLGYKPPAEPPKQAKPESRPQARPDSRKPDSRGPDSRRPDARGVDRRPDARKPGAGRVDAARGQGRPQPAAGAARPQGKSAQKPAARSEFDLGKAYALRAQQEKDERIATEAAKQEQARLRREARAKLVPLLEGKALNDPAAEHVRHFEYGGKIKRVHVTPEQLAALNRGELGVLQSEGRYLLVDAATLAEAEAIFADAIALKVDPHAPAGDDPYSDPSYQVPDDLIW
jgi:uncharacterized protein YaiL (DUF2058 family)